MNIFYHKITLGVVKKSAVEVGRKMREIGVVVKIADLQKKRQNFRLISSSAKAKIRGLKCRKKLYNSLKNDEKSMLLCFGDAGWATIA